MAHQGFRGGQLSQRFTSVVRGEQRDTGEIVAGAGFEGDASASGAPMKMIRADMLDVYVPFALQPEHRSRFRGRCRLTAHLPPSNHRPARWRHFPVALAMPYQRSKNP